MPEITHSDVDGQEMLAEPNFLLMLTAFHAPGPAVGWVELSTWWLSSTATHNPLEGHAIA
jgi:hypothetical protein